MRGLTYNTRWNYNTKSVHVSFINLAYKKFQNVIPCKTNYCYFLIPTKLINEIRQELIKECLYSLTSGYITMLYITQRHSLNFIDVILQAYLVDADVILFVSLGEQNLCWLIHGTKMIGQTAAHFKLSFTRERSSEEQHAMFTSTEPFPVNTVI